MTIWFARSINPGQAVLNDYGTRIQIKCHKPVTRHYQTKNGQTCVNWKTLDGIVEPLDKLPVTFSLGMLQLRYGWNPNYHFVNPETIGITWNDSYCRSITDSLATGCFVTRSINSSEIADDCSGLGFKYLHH